ncbi:hypothetical protein EZV62_025420 [Acer yangbiense]|uniref:Thioredoxin domain-containing protein n=1 Tax=Acer yangbiense TaxID=1000413 RepID=A0A5C7GYI4_9ROSI|nr:hypothetical protein EZV62_025420 [Acer yangbiense]
MLFSLSSLSEFGSTIRKTLLLLFISILLFTLNCFTFAQSMENPEPADQSSTTTNLLRSLPMSEATWLLIDDENVVAMTEKKYYTDYMDKKRGVVMLLFYGSNCHTSRKPEPEYTTSAMAKMLKEEVVLGLADVYESARGFFIRHYPTMCSILTGHLTYLKNFEQLSLAILIPTQAQGLRWTLRALADYVRVYVHLSLQKLFDVHV